MSQPLRQSSQLGALKRNWNDSDDAASKENSDVKDGESDGAKRLVVARWKRLRELELTLTILEYDAHKAKRGKTQHTPSSTEPTGVGRIAGLFSAPSVQAAKRSGTYVPLGLKKTSSAPLASKAFGGLQEPAQKGVASLFLSAEQRHVLDLVVKQNKNVFFTGSAGTGKSVLLRQIITDLRQKYVKRQDCVAVTASTGIAACNIGGMTLHAFAGFGLGKGTIDSLVGWILKNRKSASRWQRTSVLIIDEVSMVDAEMFDKLDAIGKRIRNSTKPFGGIQIVVTGDFFQLPPVSYGEPSFAFEAKAWESTMDIKYNLTKVFRQKDSTFVSMLNEMRMGRISAASAAKFKTLSREPKYGDGITPTELFPRREDVERSNSARLNQMKGLAMSYNSIDAGTLHPEQLAKTLTNFLAPQKLHLRVGAQVMLIKNLDETLVNGSIGEVLDFLTAEEYRSSKLVALPEPQGEAETPEQFLAIQASLQAAESQRRQSRSVSPEKSRPSMKLPLVRFSLPNGQKRDHLIEQHQWRNEATDSSVLASRTQVPLILAWAMSIHKAQGQTLNCCKVDLRRVFEKGQAYVAISRATSLEGLQVLNFDESKVLAHPKVIAWSKGLSDSRSKAGDSRS